MFGMFTTAREATLRSWEMRVAARIRELDEREAKLAKREEMVDTYYGDLCQWYKDARFAWLGHPPKKP